MSSIGSARPASTRSTCAASIVDPINRRNEYGRFISGAIFPTGLPAPDRLVADPPRPFRRKTADLCNSGRPFVRTSLSRRVGRATDARSPSSAAADASQPEGQISRHIGQSLRRQVVGPLALEGAHRLGAFLRAGSVEVF